LKGVRGKLYEIQFEFRAAQKGFHFSGMFFVDAWRAICCVSEVTIKSPETQVKEKNIFIPCGEQYPVDNYL
jgi:hypothetical protein